jgi:hypothetical protein
MPLKRQIDFKIDKLTRSIENSISGDSFKTEVIAVIPGDMKALKSKDWLFNWKAEYKVPEKHVYKLVIVDNPTIIQGLISLQDRGDHIFMHLIENNKFNRGKKKLYIGVPGNLVAFACKLSFEKGYEGFISFEAKTTLIAHYQQTLGAHILFGNIMVLNTASATKLITQYFPQDH